MKRISCIILMLALFGCDSESEDTTSDSPNDMGDCRQMDNQCSSGFSCMMTEGEVYECLPEGNAGAEVAGETAAGEMTAGEDNAGETIAGETTAGETMAGETMAGEMMAGETVAGETMANLKLFDVYQGKGIDPTRKSLGFGLIFHRIVIAF